MEQSLLISALNLTLFGIGFVFIFLTILVFVIKLMSKLINKTTINNNQHNTLLNDNVVDNETKFIIEQAIKIHTGA